jgi:hypothetical protein
VGRPLELPPEPEPPELPPLPLEAGDGPALPLLAPPPLDAGMLAEEASELGKSSSNGSYRPVQLIRSTQAHVLLKAGPAVRIRITLLQSLRLMPKEPAALREACAPLQLQFYHNRSVVPRAVQCQAMPNHSPKGRRAALAFPRSRLKCSSAGRQSLRKKPHGALFYLLGHFTVFLLIRCKRDSRHGARQLRQNAAWAAGERGIEEST